MNEIILYKSIDGNIKVDVLFEEETVWLTQAQVAQLFNRSKATVSEHIRNMFSEGELDENSVVRKFRTTAADGKSYEPLMNDFVHLSECYLLMRAPYDS